MKFIGQPESYSDILNRIFYFSLGTGFCCTLLLSLANSQIKKELESLSFNADLGLVKNVSLLYVGIPIFIGLFSRMIILHDWISTILRIRVRFDTKYILIPMPSGVGGILNKDVTKKIKKQRKDLMSKVFYPYAGFSDPLIDKHLVRTAADYWGWLWVSVESSFLLLLTITILIFIESFDAILLPGIFLIINFLIFCLYWSKCKRNAQRQVDAIYSDTTRKANISGVFHNL